VEKQEQFVQAQKALKMERNSAYVTQEQNESVISSWKAAFDRESG